RATHSSGYRLRRSRFRSWPRGILAYAPTQGLMTATPATSYGAVMGDLHQLLVAELRLQLALVHRRAHVPSWIGHLVAPQSLLRPGIERLRILDAGLLPRLLLCGRLPGRDHLLGLAKPFPGFCESDAAEAV